jgi:hypothetical protein
MLNALTTPSARSVPVFDAVAAAHLAPQTGGHAGEGHAEVGLGADLLHVRRSPARLAGEHVELHQQYGLADASQARVNEAALVSSGAEALDQRLEAFQVQVAPGEVSR